LLLNANFKQVNVFGNAEMRKCCSSAKFLWIKVNVPIIDLQKETLLFLSFFYTKPTVRETYEVKFWIQMG